MPPSDNKPQFIHHMQKKDGVGPRSIAALEKAFSSDEAFMEAPGERLLGLLHTTHIAEQVQLVQREMIAAKEEGREVRIINKSRDDRVPIWDTIQGKKKMPARLWPTEQGLESYLAKHPHCKRYTDQDKDMTKGQYRSFIRRALRDDKEQLYELIAECVTLRRTELPELELFEQGDPAPQALMRSAHGDDAVLAQLIDIKTQTGLDAFEQASFVTEAMADALTDSVLRFFEVAANYLERDIRVLVGARASEADMLVIKGPRPAGGQEPLAPVYLAQFGPCDFVAMRDLPCSPEPSAGGCQKAAQDLALPEDALQLRLVLKETLADIATVIEDIKEGGYANAVVTHAAVDRIKAHIDAINYQFGARAAVLGTNGVGKSLLLAILCSLTAEDTVPSQDHVLEGLKDSAADLGRDDDALLTLGDLTKGPLELEQPGVARVLLPSVEMVQEAMEKDRRDDAERQSLLRAGKTPGEIAPAFKGFVLPNGEAAKATTVADLTIRHGAVAHLRMVWLSAGELQARAFKYCRERSEVRITTIDEIEDVDGDVRELDPDDENDREAINALAKHYVVYKMVTTGVSDVPLSDLRVDEFPPGEARPEDVPVAKALEARAKKAAEIFLPNSGCTYTDRRLIADKISELTSELVVGLKKLVVYHPAALLQGGNDIADLPGLDTADPLEELETSEGIMDGGTGVIIVVLRRDLRSAKAVSQHLKDLQVARKVLNADEKKRRQLVCFVFNREVQQPAIKLDHLTPDSREYDDEQKDVLELCKRTRKEWLEVLKLENNARKLGIAPADLEQIAADTEMRAVYPFTHLKAELSGDASMRQLADKHSGMLWLLGTVEGLNYDLVVSSARHLRDQVLPDVLNALHATVINARVDVDVPEHILGLAAQAKRSEALELHMSSFAKSVGKELDALGVRLESCVQEFMDTEPSIYHELSKAREWRIAAGNALKRKLGRARNLPMARRALDKTAKGKWRNLEVLPVAFPQAGTGISIRFRNLLEKFEAEFDHMRTRVSELLSEGVSKLCADAAPRATSAGRTTRDALPAELISLLKGVAETSVEQVLRARCDVPEFFKAGQNAVLLVGCKPDEHFAKIARKECESALEKTVLGKGDEATTKDGVWNIIEEKCVASTEEPPYVDNDSYALDTNDYPTGLRLTPVEYQWLEEINGKLSDLVKVQMGRLRRDVLHGRKVPMCNRMFLSFFEEIRRMRRMRDAQDADFRKGVLGTAGELGHHIKYLGALVKAAEGGGLRRSPEHLGAAKRAGDVRRAFGRIELDAPPHGADGRIRASSGWPAFTLGRSTFWPGQRTGSPKPEKHVRAQGNPQSLQFTLDHLARNRLAPLEVGWQEREAHGQYWSTRSAFQAMARCLWDDASARDWQRHTAADAEGALATRLREIAAAECERYFQDPNQHATSRAALLTATGEASIESYVASIRRGGVDAMGGDTFCLFLVGRHFGSTRFRTWLPGQGQPIMLPPAQAGDRQPWRAYDIIVVQSTTEGYRPWFIPVFHRVKRARRLQEMSDIADNDGSGPAGPTELQMAGLPLPARHAGAAASQGELGTLPAHGTGADPQQPRVHGTAPGKRPAPRDAVSMLPPAKKGGSRRRM
eukprot:CAMPEP_0206032730 /NCGR_PEP_ID=MMETSP1466-20131121/150_1 /ASSEMBLY_ACC=CAM_ASM_001126 /TAXON_ID=44452 /ORGANISM="Pavlova gyrans, Strain CCMP608" /LENGTH=1604 /DNA_ID=CAMNT_0053406871 /DNA_START=26 /DNA_END=4840 /DNA_ORIENTATION=+